MIQALSGHSTGIEVTFSLLLQIRGEWSFEREEKQHFVESRTD